MTDFAYLVPNARDEDFHEVLPPREMSLCRESSCDQLGTKDHQRQHDPCKQDGGIDRNGTPLKKNQVVRADTHRFQPFW